MDRRSTTIRSNHYGTTTNYAYYDPMAIEEPLLLLLPFLLSSPPTSFLSAFSDFVLRGYGSVKSIPSDHRANHLLHISLPPSSYCPSSFFGSSLFKQFCLLSLLNSSFFLRLPHYLHDDEIVLLANTIGRRGKAKEHRDYYAVQERRGSSLVRAPVST